MARAKLEYFPIEWLQRGKFQPREQFDEQGLNELADSIKSQGLIEPLVVRPLAKEQYEIIAGERRWRAAAIAGLEQVSCLVKNYTDEQAAAVSLIENIQREDLNIIEEAQGYQRLCDEFLFYQQEVAQMVGKSRTYVTNCIRLLELTPMVKQRLIDNELSVGHAKLLLGLSHIEQQQLADQVCANQWSVRQLEKQMKSLKHQAGFSNPKKDKDVERLENLISEQCGAKVEIEQGSDNGGWLKLQYFDNDTLAGILDKMGVQYD